MTARSRRGIGGGDRWGGDRWRGKMPVPVHAHPLVRQLIAEANAQMTTLSEIAQRAGIARCTIWGWTRRAEPRLSCLAAAYGALGMQLVVVADKS